MHILVILWSWLEVAWGGGGSVFGASQNRLWSGSSGLYLPASIQLLQVLSPQVCVSKDVFVDVVDVAIEDDRCCCRRDTGEGGLQGH